MEGRGLGWVMLPDSSPDLWKEGTHWWFLGGTSLSWRWRDYRIRLLLQESEWTSSSTIELLNRNTQKEVARFKASLVSWTLLPVATNVTFVTFESRKELGWIWWQMFDSSSKRCRGKSSQYGEIFLFSLQCKTWNIHKTDQSWNFSSTNLHYILVYNLQSTNFPTQKYHLQSTCLCPLRSTIYNENYGRIYNLQFDLTPPPNNS